MKHWLRIRSCWLWVLLGLGCVISGPAITATSVVSFDTPEQEILYTRLTKEYRCLKCQNQTIADSNADLAADLRREIHARIIEGKSKAEIDDYLVARYGDFVLYRPPFKSTTYLLWLGPFLLLVIALWYLTRLNRNASAAVQSDSRDPQLAEARRLLDES